jgi:glycosyltransferase involved in cell wall biosynthesis
VNDSLRIALLLDPLTIHLEDPLRLRIKWANHAPQLARELLGRGHTVRGFGAPPGLVPRSGEDPSVEVEGKRTSRRIAGKLRSFAPDVVIAYDALSPAGLRGARVARKTGASLILVEAARRGGGRRRERALQMIGEKLWGRYVRHATDALITLDPVARDQALRMGFDPERISTVPHGVSLSRFRPGLTSTIVARHRIGGRILLYVGPLREKLGLGVLISAFAQTVGQRSDWNLVLAGEGSALPQLRAMVDRLGISAHVHWPGRPRREEIAGLMGASTLFACPALDGSVVGRQVTRALACGLPVIASDLPRLQVLVEHQHDGLLAAPGDDVAWAEAIRIAAGSPAARGRWAANARRKAEEQLGWAAVAERFEEILFAVRELREPHATPHRSLPRSDSGLDTRAS